MITYAHYVRERCNGGAYGARNVQIYYHNRSAIWMSVVECTKSSRRNAYAFYPNRALKSTFFLKMAFFNFLFNISFHIAIDGMYIEFDDASSKIA